MKKILFIMTLLAFVSCKQKQPQKEAQENVYYTCPMDVQVVSSKPGDCPVCHMPLVAVPKGSNIGEIKLSDQQIELGNIRTDTIEKGMLGDQLILTGTLNFDQLQTTAISSWVKGRIDKLYYKNTGEKITKGAKLYDLYSEDLNNAKQEYILALERQKMQNSKLIDFKQLVQSARNKLKLWGMTDAQINALANEQHAGTETTFYSPENGVITSEDVKEGDYVMEGSTILRLADTKSLWAEAQVYASQLSEIDQNGTAIVTIPDMPGRKITGKIEFVNPEINPDTRINLVRINIPNPDGALKPGMPAYIVLKNTQQVALTLPSDAVIRDAHMASVWVQTAPNTFKNKMVKLGVESNGRVAILSGLKAGDVVVVSGAYLLHSEYIFKNGTDPMAGMKM